ncbi:MAG: SDR family oxidoreductase [Lentisphaeria bacterium]|nr:SDR family oxidoreductase [Lentisphaeria bacterium]
MAQHSLKEKIVLLTGAGGGIGRAVAERLAGEGMKIILLGGNNREKLFSTQQAIEKYAPCLVFPGDLTDTAFLSESVAKAVEMWDGIDVLINNAGSAANTPFEKVSLEDFDRIMNINVRVPFFLTQLVLPHLKRSESATIINIASVTAHSGYPQQSVYSASKHALLGLTKSIAAEYYKDNIRVHAVSPGGVYTDMVKVTRPDLSPEGMIIPEDIADIVHFFLTNRGNAVIDEILVHRAGKTPFQV